MIKKVSFLDSSINCVDCQGYTHNVADSSIINKINELVDAVNSIISAQEKPIDPYTEQRKCICKLCWFWNDDKADKVIGILTGVFDEADRPFERSINQTLYKHCEPVKPDDDII